MALITVVSLLFVFWIFSFCSSLVPHVGCFFNVAPMCLRGGLGLVFYPVDIVSSQWDFPSRIPFGHRVLIVDGVGFSPYQLSPLQ